MCCLLWRKTSGGACQVEPHRKRHREYAELSMDYTGSTFWYKSTIASACLGGRKWKWGAAARYYISHTKPYYQRGSPGQDLAGNWTTRRPPDHRKETQTAAGHVSRSSGLAKTILQGTVKGGRRQGRQRKKWEDNIRKWTGLEFAESQRAVENREKWRKLVAKLSVVPQRPSRLRDRWDDEMRKWQLRGFTKTPVCAVYLF